MRKSAELLASEVRRVAAQKIKHSSGNYINNVVILEDLDGSLRVANIARNPVTGHYYGRDIEYGTASNGTGYIYPKESKVLRIPIGNGVLKSKQFKGKGPIVLADAIYTNRVRGQKGKHIFETAARNIASKTGFRYNKTSF